MKKQGAGCRPPVILSQVLRFCGFWYVSFWIVSVLFSQLGGRGRGACRLPGDVYRARSAAVLDQILAKKTEENLSIFFRLFCRKNQSSNSSAKAAARPRTLLSDKERTGALTPVLRYEIKSANLAPDRPQPIVDAGFRQVQCRGNLINHHSLNAEIKYCPLRRREVAANSIPLALWGCQRLETIRHWPDRSGEALYTAAGGSRAG